MLLIGNDLSLGHPKPGYRKDENFFAFSFSRFIELLEQCKITKSSLLLTGQHFGSLKLHQWLQVIAAIGDAKVAVYVLCFKRPSEDLIAMHKAGHIKVINNACNVTLGNNEFECSLQADSLFVTGSNTLLQLNTRVGQCSLNANDSLPIPNCIQQSSAPSGFLFLSKTGTTYGLAERHFDNSQFEHELVSMDYIESLPVLEGKPFESDFSERLSKAANLSEGSRSIELLISKLDLDARCKHYLVGLAEKAKVASMELDI